MTLADLRRALDAAVAELPTVDVADAIGLCAAAQSRLLAKLTAPAPVADHHDELVTAETVAERFHLALSSVHELARQGKIPCRMFGRWRRFNLAEVAAAGLDSKTPSLAPISRREKAA